MLDLMQQELDFSRGEALTLASLTVDLIRRPAFTYRSSSVPGKPRTLHLAGRVSEFSISLLRQADITPSECSQYRSPAKRDLQQAGRYSARSTCIGSSVAARHAGRTHAIAPTTIGTDTAPSRVSASDRFPPPQDEMIGPQISVTIKPVATQRQHFRSRAENLPHHGRSSNQARSASRPTTLAWRRSRG